MRRHVGLAGFIVAAASALFLCVPVGAADKHYSIVTAAPGGNWYTMVGAATGLYTKRIPGSVFTLAGTGGSVENSRRFVAGEADFGPIYSSNLYEIYNGVGTAKGRPKSDAAQVMFEIYDSPHYFVVLKSSNIRSIKDLQGKRVALGAPGSGTTQNSRLVFDTLGMKVNGVELSFGDAARQLQDGKIDALGQGGAPASGIVELAASQEIVIIPFSNEELEKIIAVAPYYFKGQLKAGTYRGQAKAVPAFSVAVFFVAHKDIPADLVYRVMQVTFEPESLAYLAKAHPEWKNAKDHPEAVKQLAVKYHPGAAKYWAEKH
jgi:TRAP transporter TAXI family solute receptor